MKTTLGLLVPSLVLLILTMGCTQPASPGTVGGGVAAKAALGPRDARLVFHLDTAARSVHTLGEIGFLTVQLLSPQNEMVRFGKAAKAAVQPDPNGVDFVVDFPQLEAGTWNARVLLYDKEQDGTLLFYALQPILIQVGVATSVPALSVYEPGSVGGVTFVEGLPPASITVNDQYLRTASGTPVEWPLNTSLQLSARVDSATLDGGTGLFLPAREQGVKWSSNQPQVARVDGTGLVQTMGNLGSAVLTATSTFDPGIASQFLVTVVPTIVGTWSAVGPGGRALVQVNPVPGTTGFHLTLFSHDPKTFGGTFAGPLRVTPSEAGWFPDDYYPGSTLDTPRVASYFAGFYEAVVLPDPMTLTLAQEPGINPQLPAPFDRMATAEWTLSRVPDFTPVTTLTPVAVTANLVSGSSFPFAVATDGLATFHDGSLLSWSTSDTSILSVDPSGLVRGRTPGTANVIVRSLDHLGASLSFGVTVAPGPAAPVAETVNPALVMGSGLPGGTGWFNAVDADLAAPGWILVGSAGGGGRFSPAGLLLTRLTLSGQVDRSFGTNGVTYEPGNNAWGVAQDPQAPHDIVVQANGGQYSRTALWRFQNSGQPKPGYGSGGYTSTDPLYTEGGPHSPLFQANGDLVVLGRPSDPAWNFSLVNVSRSGVFNQYWTSTAQQWTQGAAMEPNGSVVLSQYNGFVTRVAPNGTDTSFGFAFGPQDYRTELQPPESDGDTNTPFLPAVGVDSQHRVYVVGRFTRNGESRSFIARLTASGTLDITYGGAGDGYNHPGYWLLPSDCAGVCDLAMNPDGSVVAVGGGVDWSVPQWVAVVAPDGVGLLRRVNLVHPGWTNGLTTAAAVDAAGNIGVSGYLDEPGIPQQPAFWMVAK